MAGPTAALDALYPLGLWGLALYGNVRGSVLIGHYNHTADTGLNFVAGGTPFPVPVTSASAGRNAAVPEAEVEFGVSWSGNFGNVKPSLRVGVAAQNYFNALNNNNVVGVTPSPNTLNGDLTFFGLTVTAGVAY